MHWLTIGKSPRTPNGSSAPPGSSGVIAIEAGEPATEAAASEAAAATKERRSRGVIQRDYFERFSVVTRTRTPALIATAPIHLGTTCFSVTLACRTPMST